MEDAVIKRVVTKGFTDNGTSQQRPKRSRGNVLYIEAGACLIIWRNSRETMWPGRGQAIWQQERSKRK